MTMMTLENILLQIILLILILIVGLFTPIPIIISIPIIFKVGLRRRCLMFMIIDLVIFVEDGGGVLLGCAVVEAGVFVFPW